MRSFTDTKGREWDVRITTLTVEQARAAGADIMSVIRDDAGRLAYDYALIGTVLYFACKKQAESRGVDRESFLDSLSGDALAGAVAAFLGALSDFFPDPRMRSAIRAGLEELSAGPGSAPATAETSISASAASSG